LAYQSSDDGFREIQLNGKQLVFLFMAATVVSVVIFLCGVLVGRGARPASADPATVASAESAVTEIPVETPAAAPPAITQPEVAEPPPTPADELTYYERLEKDKPPAETLKPQELQRKKPAPPPPAPVASRTTPPAAAQTTAAAAAPVPATPAAATPAPATPTAPPPATPAPTAVSTSGEPGGPGYVVQVAALQVRVEADGIARRLSGKGYPAYVTAPASGASAPIYRVRVGKYKSRREAEQVAARLEKEEQFKPWISR
jgi:cell division septation protein DedD